MKRIKNSFFNEERTGLKKTCEFEYFSIILFCRTNDQKFIFPCRLIENRIKNLKGSENKTGKKDAPPNYFTKMLYGVIPLLFLLHSCSSIHGLLQLHLTGK